jgi:DNA mismatch endonuclease (patch repair protein)
MALIVAGTFAQPSYWASFRAARMLAAINRTRLRPSSTSKSVALSPCIRLCRVLCFGSEGTRHGGDLFQQLRTVPLSARISSIHRHMSDIFSQSKRSWVMSRIGQKDTRPEILARRFLHSHGYRFRLQAKNLPGTPDLVLPRLKTVIFVNGCFWHRHSHCSRAALPQSNRAFWEKKISRNAERDKATRRLLRRQGWSVITIWECQLKNLASQTECLNRVLMRLEAK